MVELEISINIDGKNTGPGAVRASVRMGRVILKLEIVDTHMKARFLFVRVPNGRLGQEWACAFRHGLTGLTSQVLWILRSLKPESEDLGEADWQLVAVTIRGLLETMGVPDV